MSAPSGEQRLLLIDGRAIAVRTTTSDDADRIAALISGLSPASRAMRFGYARGPLSREEAAAMAAAPGVGGTALIALAGDELERAVGLVRYDRVPAAREAELAVAVDDAWQGLGLGTGLIGLLLAHATRDGLDALWASVHWENWRMLQVFRTMGGHVREIGSRDEVMVRLRTTPDERFEEAEAARFANAAAASLEPLFRPSAIAVVGASRDPAAPGGAVFRALLASGFAGPVFPVNRSSASVAGHTAYPALATLPEPADLVVVAVPAPEVPAVARDAASHGARALIVLTSGFAESGRAGAQLEAELLHIVRVGGLRMVGPNCLGMASTDPQAPFDATFGPAPPPPGNIALGAQSGGIGIGALEFCAEYGLGLSAFVSLGNKVDVSSNDLLAWWARDERTRVILLHLESFGNPRRFSHVARHVARQTPIVVLKAGRRAAGRRAAGSHTAALTAGEAPTDALFDLAGVVRVDTVEQLFEVGRLLADQPMPAGDRVAIVSSAGGPAILAADACEAEGVRVPTFDDALRARLAELWPGVAGTSNPVDLGAGAPGEAVRAAVGAIVDADAADAILVIHAWTHGRDPAPVVAATQAVADGRVPIVGCLVGHRPPTRADAPWPVPWVEFPERGAQALAFAIRAGEARRREHEPPPHLEGVDREGARRALESAAPGEWLAPEAAEALLRAYRVPVARSMVVGSPADAAAARAAIGAPVAVKAVGEGIVHRSDVGGVVLGCVSPEAAAAAFRAMETRLAAAGAPPMTAALVQEMAGDGLDLIVGATADPLFGPLVLAGMGGVQAELWGDRAVALAPVGARGAAEMWSRLRGAPLLDGWRGSPVADREGLADVVVRVSQLAADQPLLAELDCNPVRALGPGRGVLVLDVRARRAEA